MVDGEKKSTLLSKFPFCITGILQHPHQFYLTYNFPDDTDTVSCEVFLGGKQESKKASLVNCSWFPWCRATFHPLLLTSSLPLCWSRRPDASPQSLPS